ncbi:hypothetical protein V1477_008337 [Vespula maculifrons]|uniref:Uncharacterized protein n=1 Tax=Vespula maculifrons TaxID=7453 RepID=A0ABD2CF03_VESMC
MSQIIVSQDIPESPKKLLFWFFYSLFVRYQHILIILYKKWTYSKEKIRIKKHTSISYFLNYTSRRKKGNRIRSKQNSKLI